MESGVIREGFLEWVRAEGCGVDQIKWVCGARGSQARGQLREPWRWLTVVCWDLGRALCVWGSNQGSGEGGGSRTPWPDQEGRPQEAESEPWLRLRAWAPWKALSGKQQDQISPQTDPHASLRRGCWGKGFQNRGQQRCAALDLHHHSIDLSLPCAPVTPAAPQGGSRPTRAARQDLLVIDSSARCGQVAGPQVSGPLVP